ncbi:hypothetical protein JCM17823_08480 [Halorubrum gandharaense]
MIRGDRGQSEVLGVVLLLGITVMVVGSTVAIGSVALSDAQSTAELERAESAMTQVDSKASLVAHGESTSQSVTVTDGDGDTEVRVDEDAGWLNISVSDGNSETNRNVPLGAVTLEHDEETVTYQGGGVWRGDGETSRMVSPPEFHYRSETLSLPLVTVAESGTTDGEVQISDAGDPMRTFPNGEVDNPIVGGNVTITVESEYHEAWGDFFEDRTETDVERLDGDRVRVELPTQAPTSDVTDSISAITAGSGFDLSNSDVEELNVSTYDSAEDEYNTSNATVWFDGDVGADSSSDERIWVYGDLHASGQSTPNPSSWEDDGRHGIWVEGDVHTANHNGDDLNEPAVDGSEVIDGIVDDRIAEFDDRNLSETATREEDDLEADGETISEDTYVDGDVEIEESSLDLASDGDLAVEVSGGLDMESDDSPAEMTLDTGNEGDEIHLMVRDDFEMDGDGSIAEIEVVGEGEATLYFQEGIEIDGSPAEISVAESATVETYHDADDNVEFGTDGSPVRVTTGDGNTPGPAGNFWFFSKTEEIEMDGDEGSVDFNGILYAPNAEADIQGTASVDGALVVDDMDLNEAELEVRFDEAAGQHDPFVDRESISRVNHLHVTRHPVHVEDE